MNLIGAFFSFLGSLIGTLGGLAGLLRWLEIEPRHVKAWLTRSKVSEIPMTEAPIQNRKRKLIAALLLFAFSFASTSYGFYLLAKKPKSPIPTGIYIAYQKAIPSADPQFPFGLEVGIQTDEEYTQPAQLFIMCDGDIGRGHGIKLVNGGDLEAVDEAVMAPPAQTWYHPDVFNLKWRAPLWKLDDTLVVHLYSKTRIKVNSAVPIIFRVNIP